MHMVLKLSVVIEMTKCILDLTIIHMKSKIRVFTKFILHHKAVVAVQVLPQNRVQECRKWLDIRFHEPVNNVQRHAMSAAICYTMRDLTITFTHWMGKAD